MQTGLVFGMMLDGEKKDHKQTSKWNFTKKIKRTDNLLRKRTDLEVISLETRRFQIKSFAAVLHSSVTS